MRAPMALTISIRWTASVRPVASVEETPDGIVVFVDPAASLSRITRKYSELPLVIVTAMLVPAKLAMSEDPFAWAQGAGTMGMLGVHEATLRSMMLMGFYCAFVGVVIFFILSLSHPFEGIGRVTPEAFQVLRDQTAP
jgi:hypothetical protein